MQGVMLLKVYHSDQDKVRSLERFQNTHLLNQLMDELYNELKAKKSNNVIPAVPIQPLIPQSTSLISEVVIAPIISPKKEIKIKSADLRKIEDIKKARTHLYKERAAFHKEMGDVAFTDTGSRKSALTKYDIDRRHELAKLIISHTTEIDQYWSTQDYYEVHGHFPFEHKEKVSEPIQLTNADALRKLMNVRSTITKTNQKIADAKVLLPHLSGKPLDKKKKQLQEWDAKLKIAEAEKAELQQQIQKTTDEQKDN